MTAPNTPLDPDMPAQELRLHMGELTGREMLVARAAIRWANSTRVFSGAAIDRLAYYMADANELPWCKLSEGVRQGFRQAARALLTGDPAP